MRVTMFSARAYDREYFSAANADAGHELSYLEARLTPETAPLAEGSEVACVFVTDDAGAATLERLAEAGVRLLALRSTGFNHVDLAAAQRLGLTVVRVPAYSPYAVAEHTAGLVLALNRRIHRAYNRVREGNFALEGLLGFDLHERTVGIVGTGVIGSTFARIMSGFGCRLLAYDARANPECERLGVSYVTLGELLGESEVISLHAPLTPETHHLIDAEAFAAMRDGAMLINTSRGGLVDTVAAIEALKTGRLGALGLDVYEEEEGLFFENLSEDIIADDVFSRLLTFPNVLVTGHQAFFTREALEKIAAVTLANITAFEGGDPSGYHELSADRYQPAQTAARAG